MNPPDERRTRSLLRALRQQGCSQGSRCQRIWLGHRRRGRDHRLASQRIRQCACRRAPQLRGRADQLHSALHLRARAPASHWAISSGYGRFEDVATLLIIFVIIATAAAAAAESVAKLIYPTNYSNIALGLGAAIVGVIANVAVSEYKVRVGRGIGSESLTADGIHSRIDALVSASRSPTRFLTS